MHVYIVVEIQLTASIRKYLKEFNVVDFFAYVNTSNEYLFRSSTTKLKSKWYSYT